MRVAALHDNKFERMQHLNQAQEAGLTEKEIAEIEANEIQTPEFRLIMDFVNECVANAKVSDDTFAGVRSVLSDSDIAAVILLIGHYMMVARFISILEIELDAQPASWKSEH